MKIVSIWLAIEGNWKASKVFDYIRVTPSQHSIVFKYYLKNCRMWSKLGRCPDTLTLHTFFYGANKAQRSRVLILLINLTLINWLRRKGSTEKLFTYLFNENTFTSFHSFVFFLSSFLSSGLKFKWEQRILIVKLSPYFRLLQRPFLRITLLT